MPVYVTRAHVTIGDASRRHGHKRAIPKHAFHVADICKTPYFFRAVLVTFIGAAIVTGGVIMTIIGYKPGILLPWYQTYNYTTNSNSSDPTSVPKGLGEPGPLRLLVYIGPTLMGVGFFAMMMTIVLFCEIKDRYFNNILPKPSAKDRKKDKMYDLIIDEFRKNYFRGIEVPLKKNSERRKSKRFSFSLTRSGSLASLGKKISQDLQKRRRKHSRESQSERVSTSKHKRSTLRRILDPDSWMKTSSLPNITHKSSTTDLHNMRGETAQSININARRTSKSCATRIFNISDDTNGVDNMAYKDSPPDKRNISLLKEQTSLDSSGSNVHITTVLVHREPNNEDNATAQSNSIPVVARKFESVSEYSENDFCVDMNSDDSVIDIDRDIQLIPKPNEILRTIPRLNTDVRTNPDLTKRTDTIVGDMCTCDSGTFCHLHSLGMDSGGSSLSLSWDNVPCEWNDARRNTEPHAIYQKCNQDEVSVQINTSMSIDTSNCANNYNSIDKLTDRITNNTTSGSSKTDNKSKSIIHHQTRRDSLGPFKTRIGVFKSDSNLQRVGTYSRIPSNKNVNSSAESLELTEIMLKNFEMADTTYI